MRRNCYVVEMNSALAGLFEQLDDHGFDYECEEHRSHGISYIEICVLYYPHEIQDLENIFAPYV